VRIPPGRSVRDAEIIALTGDFTDPIMNSHRLEKHLEKNSEDPSKGRRIRRIRAPEGSALTRAR